MGLAGGGARRRGPVILQAVAVQARAARYRWPVVIVTLVSGTYLPAGTLPQRALERLGAAPETTTRGSRALSLGPRSVTGTDGGPAALDGPPYRRAARLAAVQRGYAGAKAARLSGANGHPVRGRCRFSCGIVRRGSGSADAGWWGGPLWYRGGLGQ